MSGRSSFLSHPWRVLRWAGLAAAIPAVWACTSRTLEQPVLMPTQTFTNKVTQKINNNIDILFMIDNSSSMDTMQAKLYAQLGVFIQVLQALPMGLPSIQIAVVSSDMGAPSDQGQQGISCSQIGGDNGIFFNKPEGTCIATNLNAGDTFIKDDASGNKNFSEADPPGIIDTFKCISLLGSAGCGFEHQLSSIDRALGGDGSPPPAANANFVRDGAYLGIVMLTNEDDCSAPLTGTQPIYSLNGANANDINTPGGPISNYRCNGGQWGGHLCQDTNQGSPDMSLQQPPVNPPSDATGSPPTLTLSNCISNDTASSGLTPVSKFISDIKSLKPDPSNQILVAAVTGVNGTAPNLTPTPYTVEWLPGPGADSNQLWPQIEHLCGPTSDGSFADPAVRISQFVNAFGANGVLASICDASYQSSMSAIAQKIGALLKPKCVAGTIQTVNGQPNCTVINEVTNLGKTTNITVPSCASAPGAAPCWALNPPDMNNNCPAGTQALTVSTDPANMNPDSLDSVIQCETCVAGVPNVPGCP